MRKHKQLSAYPTGESGELSTWQVKHRGGIAVVIYDSFLKPILMRKNNGRLTNTLSVKKNKKIKKGGAALVLLCLRVKVLPELLITVLKNEEFSERNKDLNTIIFH